MDADPIDAEDFAPDLCDHFLRGRAGGMIGASHPDHPLLRGGEPFAIDLPVGREGECFEGDEVGRDHEAGKPLGQEVAQRLQRAGAREDHVGDEEGVPIRAMKEDDRRFDGGVRAQRRLDLTQFDSESPDLHLVVPAPQIGDIPGGEVAADIPRAVKNAPLPEGIRQEAFRGHFGTVEIATGKPHARHVDLPGHADRNGIETGVEEVDPVVRDRPADRHLRGIAELPGVEAGHVRAHLGGAVDVEEHPVRNLAVEAAAEFGGHGLSARHPILEVGELAPQIGEGIEEDPQEGGDEDDPGDVVGAQRLDEPVGVLHLPVVEDHEGDTAPQRAEGLPEGIDEAQCGLLAPHFSFGEGIRPPHPFEAVDRAGVEADHPLGSSRRSRGIDDVGRVMGRDGEVEGGLGFLQQKLLCFVEEEGFDLALEVLEGFPCGTGGHDEAGAGISQHEGEPFLRIAGIEGQVCPPRLEDPEDRGERFDRAAGQEGDGHFGGHTAAPQRMGDPVGLAIERAEGDRALRRTRGDPFRRGRGLPFESSMDRPRHEIGDRRVVPYLEEQVTFPFREGGEARQRGLGVRKRALEEHFEMAEHPLDRLGLEASGMVEGAEGEPLPRHDEEGEGKIRPFHEVEVRDPDLFPEVEEARIEGVVLEDEQTLEEGGAPRNLTPPLDFDEGGVLEVARFEFLPLQAGEEGSKRRLPGDPNAYRQGVDEESDDRFHPREFRGPPRDGGPEEDIVLSGVACQQQGPEAPDQVVRRDPLRAAERIDARGRRFGEGVFAFVRIEVARLDPLCGPIDAERGWCGETPQVLAPEGLCRAEILFLEPGDVILVGAGGGQIDRLFLNCGHVESQNLLEDEGEAPSVEEEVVVAPEETVAPFAELEEGQAHEGGLVEREALLAVLGEESLEILFGGFLPLRPPVVAFDPDLDPPSDDLEGLLQIFPDEGGAKRGVAIRDLLPCFLEAIDRERAGEGAVELLEIDLTLRGEEGMEKHPLLHRGEGVDRFDILPHRSPFPRSGPCHRPTGLAGKMQGVRSVVRGRHISISPSAKRRTRSAPSNRVEGESEGVRPPPPGSMPPEEGRRGSAAGKWKDSIVSIGCGLPERPPWATSRPPEGGTEIRRNAGSDTPEVPAPRAIR